MRKLIAASGNAGKLNEFRQILGDYFNVISVFDVLKEFDVDEIYPTMMENAVLKAQWVYERLNCATAGAADEKFCVVADDSGLTVNALGGEPGVYSARYSGGGDKANNQKLLRNLQGIADRSAAFVCCIAFIDEDGRLTTAEGITEGNILHGEEGNNGFGYDPLFYSPQLKKSFGIATADEKNSLSHRARALNALLQKLKNYPNLNR